MERTLPRTQPTALASRPTPTAWPLRLLAALLLWRQRARTRRQLAQLDERLLADAGICAAERHAELAKPFWR
ncbi:DUF1127 domain-containing protein [Pseudomonas sp. R-28-1W-6]|uniref:DUF1127 domain-containing protein n=1 Tax=Pseudomonas sp. R-28-1W-6 TaxID=2650101 RepID=UPI0013666704|nr:DUF1127 domain-containing protein [Pseudomonas sp. R-28-1W-6]MWV10995.1 DUF1127 domain-containing protein [Pseudomonas sp. R-28-1W-6]